jgi:signal transduction histidine kinase
MKKNSKKLQWKFDISTFKLLGRELITDRITALFELVKNCYDANADNVTVEFYNVSEITKDSKIIIKDDGVGMSFEDIQFKWMVIGTNSKREKSKSPPPYNRKFVGEKGVGRFAVDKLGSKLLLSTKTEDSTDNIFLDIDWRDYERESKQLDLFPSNQQRTYFTEIENKSWIEQESSKRKGTILEISLTEYDQVWTIADIDKAYNELSKIVSPLENLPYPFNIYITSNEFEEYKKPKLVENKAIKHATFEKTIGWNKESGMQEVLSFKNNELTISKVPIYDFGGITFKIYYFDRVAKAQFKKKYKGGNIDGIKLYRDGIITTPFAEYESQDIKKRDILGIDKRRYSGFFDKVSSNDLLGQLEISKEHNPRIKDATNRQDFVDTPEYRNLKRFIINQIEQLEKFISSQKEKTKEKTKNELEYISNDIKQINEAIEEISPKASPEVKERLQEIQKQTKKVQRSVTKGARTIRNLETEITRKENVFLSLMSLQDYATELSHVVRTSLSKIIHLAEFFKTDFPNPKLNELFLSYAKGIYEEMIKLDKAVDFMLSYAKSESDFEKISLRELMVSVFKSFEHILEKEEIKTVVEIDDLEITHNRKFFEDIIENLISNSIKALKNTDNKLIKCSGKTGDNNYQLLFSDNGIGIDVEDRERIFEIYYTNTPQLGGAGIGLFTVKKRIEALKGTVEVTENELKPTGATIKIVLPYSS